jgi:hypothetical protein
MLALALVVVCALPQLAEARTPDGETVANGSSLRLTFEEARKVTRRAIYRNTEGDVASFKITQCNRRSAVRIKCRATYDIWYAPGDHNDSCTAWVRVTEYHYGYRGWWWHDCYTQSE